MRLAASHAQARAAGIGVAIALAWLGATSVIRAAKADAPAEVSAESELIPLAGWQEPSRDMRPVARWWWPGGSVEPEVIERHLAEIAKAGFGGVELQPLLLGIGDEDLAADAKLRSVGQPEFLKRVNHAAQAAQRAGLAFDLTLGSGWPGGLPTGKANAQRQLLMSSIDLTGPSRFQGPLPEAPDQSYRRAVEWILDVLGPRDKDATLVAVLAAHAVAAHAGPPTLEEVRVITSAAKAGKLDWEVPDGDWRVFAFYENSTEHFVMGGAYPGLESDARVVDHLSARGAEALLSGYGAPVLAAAGPGRVREIFVDSFELMGELPFTSEFLAAFRTRAGYDLTPHLPLLFRKGGESKYAEMIDILGRYGDPLYATAEPEIALRIREDYETVRRELFEERFVGRIAEWTHERNVALRLQAHGGYGNYLDTYARADVPESEALFAGGRFDFLKLAASAAHVAGRRWASSESFITLRLFGTTLSNDEMRLLAGRAYSAGINRLAFHGVPYPYMRADGKVWFPFSGGFGRILAGPLPMSFHFDSAALAELPAFNRFLARLSLAMTRGEPAAPVAWLRADPIYPDEASFQLGRIETHAGESETTRALRARGLVHDRVSRRMLEAAKVTQGGVFEVGQRRYRALLLDPIDTAEPALAESLAAIAEAGVPVLALGGLPSRAPGLRERESRDARIRAAASGIGARAIRVPNADRLEGLLAQHVESDWVGPPDDMRLEVSIEARTSANGDILLVFNESWQTHAAQLRMNREGGALEVWDPRTGSRSLLREQVRIGDIVTLELEPAETLVLTLGR